MQRDEYISRFSHELRNPLTLINSSLQLLEKECPAIRESPLWEQIRKDMVDVIQLLRDMSAPFGRLQPAAVNAAEFLSELCASFAPSMELRGIHFVAKLPDELSGIVLDADRQKLKQALTNLLLNAADAVCESGSGRITLYADMGETALHIHIRDNGPGIPQEYLADLFEPFVTHKKNGTGLGLSVAKAVAEQHGGSLLVDTRTHCAAPAASAATFGLSDQVDTRTHDADSAASAATFGLSDQVNTRTHDAAASACTAASCPECDGRVSSSGDSSSESYTDFCLTLPVNRTEH